MKKSKALLHYFQANHKRKLFRFEEAKESIQKALNLEQDDPYFFLEAAKICRHLKEFEQSSQFIEQALKIGNKKFYYKEILIGFFVEYALILFALDKFSKCKEILGICALLFEESDCWDLESYIQFLYCKGLVEWVLEVDIAKMINNNLTVFDSIGIFTMMNFAEDLFVHNFVQQAFALMSQFTRTFLKLSQYEEASQYFCQHLLWCLQLCKQTEMLAEIRLFFENYHSQTPQEQTRSIAFLENRMRECCDLCWQNKEFKAVKLFFDSIDTIFSKVCPAASFKASPSWAKQRIFCVADRVSSIWKIVTKRKGKTGDRRVSVAE